MLNPAEAYPREAWDWIMELNVRSTIVPTMAVARRLIEQGHGGAVLNITSVRANLGINAGYSAYVAAKGAISSLTRQWATEWAKYGIRANAIMPTFVDTPAGRDAARRPGVQGRHRQPHPAPAGGRDQRPHRPRDLPVLGRRVVRHGPGPRDRRRPDRNAVDEERPTMSMMEAVTANVSTITKLRGCNPSFVTTSDGVVVIDTPQLPTKAVAMRAEAEAHGPIRFIVNTEHHVDHIFGNYWFKGAGTVVNHLGLYERFMVVFPELDPFAYAYESVPGETAQGTDLDDPAALDLWPDREVYYQDPNKGRIVFTGDVTLRVGNHTFNCLHTPGHTPGQLAVHVPEEGVVFTGDTIFSGCQTWLMTSDVDQWLAALERIRSLDFERIVPGHGPVVPKSYLDVQRSVLLAWKSAVATAIAKGWSRDETIARVNFKDEFGPGRHRPGLHARLHPVAQRRRALRQAHRHDAAAHGTERAPGQGLTRGAATRGPAARDHDPSPDRALHSRGECAWTRLGQVLAR